MKELVLVRHAKSSWSDPSLTDKDRPLNKRGLRDAPRMGARLMARYDGVPGLKIVASPALRAVSTAQILAGELGLGEAGVVERQAVYPGAVADLLEVVEMLADEWERVLLVGHNPGLSELALELTGECLKHMPTCGMVAIRFAVESWVDAMPGRGELAWLDCPKRPGEL